MGKWQPMWTFMPNLEWWHHLLYAERNAQNRRQNVTFVQSLGANGPGVCSGKMFRAAHLSM